MFRVVSAATVSESAPPPAPAPPRVLDVVTVLRLAVIPLVVAVSVFVAWRLGYFDLEHRQQLARLAKNVHAVPWSETAYVAAYAVAVTMALPATIVTLLGGAVFGLWEGALLAWLGSLAGTWLAHTLARHVMRSALTRVLGEHRLLRRLRERDDVLALFRLRILPVAPFGVLAYVAGVAGASLPRLLLATMFGVAPSVVAFSYVGVEVMRGLEAGYAASYRAMWIAGGATVVMLALSLVPVLLQRGRE